jgi:chromosomal replication initiation ATPase DnaA
VPREPSQIPLQFGHVPATTRDDLVISDPLSTAVGLIDRWPDWPSPVVILTGPSGAGKSHLAAVWQEMSGAVPLAASGFDEARAIEAAASGPVLVEDADRAGLSDEALFHLINTVREHATALMMTTRMWPSAWDIALPDLRSRLAAATVVEIGEPDDELLAQVIVKLFADRQVRIDPKVVAYLVTRMERSFDAAQQIVERMDGLALARRCRISRALAAEALAGFGRNDIEDDPS